MVLNKNIKWLLFILGISGIFATLYRFYKVQKQLIIDATKYRIAGITASNVSIDNVTLNAAIEITNNSDISVHLNSVALNVQASFDGGNTKKYVASINNVQDTLIPARSSFVLENVVIQINPKDFALSTGIGGILDIFKNKSAIIYINGKVYFTTDFLKIKADAPVDMQYEFKM